MARPSQISGLAIASLVLGIVGLLISIVGGGVLGIVGLVLGIISISQMNKQPQRLGGKGLAITGVCLSSVSIALTLLVVLMIFPAMRRANELSNRSYCALNLRSILQSANVYANDNRGDFPIVTRPTTGTLSFAGGKPVSSAEKTWESMYTSTGPAGNVTANMWILVLKNYTSPKQYLCKSDPNNSKPADLASGGNYYNNFAGVENLSYSMAVPWQSDGTQAGFWRDIMDSGTPLMADMAPRHGESVRGGTIAVNVVQTNPALWSSPIHNGDGQNVGFSDAHCEWTRRPDVGTNNDNIWTHSGGRGPSNTGDVPLYGPGVSTGSTTAPFPSNYRSGSSGNFDIYMLPARGKDGKTY